MTRVKLYGQPTSVYEYLKAMLREEALRAGIQIELEEIHDLHKIINNNIESIPTIQINDHHRFTLKMKDVNDLLKEVRMALLRAENFGNMKQLIIPVDFSETANNALDYAVKLAPELSAMLRVVHFFHPTTAGFEGEFYLNVELEKVHKSQLEKVVEKCQKKLNELNQDIILAHDFELGFPSTGIPNLADEIENGLIVMGSTGEGGALKKLFGSVSMDVAKNSKMPVLLIPPEASFSDVKRIAYATNNMKLDASILDELTEMAAYFDAELLLVHVTNDKDPFSPYEALDMWDSHYDQSKISYYTLDNKNIVEAVNDFAEKENVDWIAMATENRGFFGELLHKSTTKEMARFCKKPLLVFHREDK